MIAYSDTSFLCALYRKQINSNEAAEYFKKITEPLIVSSLLLFEFRQSIRFQAFIRSKDINKGFDMDEGFEMLRDLQTDIAEGIINIISINWAEVHNFAERLSVQYTLKNGNRGFDILHVATALHLGVKEFLTFDTKQKKLANAEGLKTPLKPIL